VTPPPSAPYRYEGQAWRAGVTRIAGLDEAGRGPLAGPVVAAAIDNAYAAVRDISFEGAHYRRDIGARALETGN